MRFFIALLLLLPLAVFGQGIANNQFTTNRQGNDVLGVASFRTNVVVKQTNIVGNVRITNTFQLLSGAGASKVLTDVSGDGFGTWQTPGGGGVSIKEGTNGILTVTNGGEVTVHFTGSNVVTWNLTNNGSAVASIDGSGTSNRVAKFTSNGTWIVDSLIKSTHTNQVEIYPEPITLRTNCSMDWTLYNTLTGDGGSESFQLHWVNNQLQMILDADVSGTVREMAIYRGASQYMFFGQISAVDAITVSPFFHILNTSRLIINPSATVSVQGRGFWNQPNEGMMRISNSSDNSDTSGLTWGTSDVEIRHDGTGLLQIGPADSTSVTAGGIKGTDAGVGNSNVNSGTLIIAAGRPTGFGSNISATMGNNAIVFRVATNGVTHSDHSGWSNIVVFNAKTNIGLVYTNYATSAFETNVVVRNGIIRIKDSINLTADNQVVGGTNTAFIALSSDSAVATDRTFVLTTGVDGKVITFTWIGTNAGELADDGANSGAGNVRLSATWTPTQYDTLTVIGVGDDWHEISRSAN